MGAWQLAVVPCGPLSVWLLELPRAVGGNNVFTTDIQPAELFGREARRGVIELHSVFLLQHLYAVFCSLRFSKPGSSAGLVVLLRRQKRSEQSQPFCFDR